MQANSRLRHSNHAKTKPTSMSLHLKAHDTLYIPMQTYPCKEVKERQKGFDQRENPLQQLHAKDIKGQKDEL